MLCLKPIYLEKLDDAPWLPDVVIEMGKKTKRFCEDCFNKEQAKIKKV